MNPDKGWNTGLVSKNIFIYLVGNSLLTVISLASTAVFTRYLSIDQFGLVSVFFASCLMFAPFFSLNLYSGIPRIYYIPKIDMNKYINNNIFISLISFVLFAFFFILFRIFFSTLLKLPVTFIILIPLLLICENFFRLYEQYLVVQKKSLKIETVRIIKALMMFFFSFLFVILLNADRGLFRIIGYIVAYLIITFYVLYDLRLKLRMKIFLPELRFGLAYCLPLIVVGISSMIMNYIDRIMLNYYVGYNDVGLYSFAYNIGYMVSLFSSAIIRGWFPFYFDEIKKHDLQKIKKQVKVLFFILTMIAVLILYFVNEIAVVLGPAEYDVSLKIVPIIIIGYLFMYFNSFIILSINFMNKTKFLTFSVIIAAGINIILNIIFIPLYSYMGAAYATIISQIIVVFINYIMIKVYIKEWFCIKVSWIWKEIVFLGLVVGFYFFIKLYNLSTIFLYAKISSVILFPFFLIFYLKKTINIDVLLIIKKKIVNRWKK